MNAQWKCLRPLTESPRRLRSLHVCNEWPIRWDWRLIANNYFWFIHKRQSPESALKGRDSTQPYRTSHTQPGLHTIRTLDLHSSAVWTDLICVKDHGRFLNFLALVIQNFHYLRMLPSQNILVNAYIIALKVCNDTIWRKFSLGLGNIINIMKKLYNNENVYIAETFQLFSSIF